MSSAGRWPMSYTHPRLPTTHRRDAAMSSDSERDRLHQAVLRHATFSMGSSVDALTPRERFLAVALAVRDRMIEHMLQTDHRYRQTGAKRLYYLSMEFLIGRS